LETFDKKLAVPAGHHHGKPINVELVESRGGDQDGGCKSAHGNIPAKRKAARRRNANPYPREASWPAIDGDPGGPAVRQQFGDHRDKALGMASPNHFVPFIDDFTASNQRRRTRSLGGIDGKQHGAS
jgi:hypothetical protein